MDGLGTTLIPWGLSSEVGSNPTRDSKNGPLAQMEEHIPSKDTVPGSSPGWVTTEGSRMLVCRV